MNNGLIKRDKEKTPIEEQSQNKPKKEKEKEKERKEIIELEEKERFYIGIEYWTLFIAQILYVSSRTLAISLPLTVLYELISTFILKIHRRWRTKGFLLLRLILLAFASILSVSIQYVFDLTYIAGVVVLYLFVYFLLLFASFAALPYYLTKVIMILIFPIVTACFYDSGIFTEPWVLLLLTINWFAVSAVVLLVPVFSDVFSVPLYFFFWALALIIYNSFLGIQNKYHSFSHYI
jgi:hypothetical protein